MNAQELENLNANRTASLHIAQEKIAANGYDGALPNDRNAVAWDRVVNDCHLTGPQLILLQNHLFPLGKQL